MKDFFISRIDSKLNSIYRTKLSIKLNIELNFYSDLDEVYFISRFNNSSEVIGISRILFNFEKYIDKQHKSFKDNLSKTTNNIFLTGIWVEETHRNKGVGKELLNRRLRILKKGDNIFTDMRRESPLNKHYLEIGMNVIGEDKEHIYYGGIYNGKLV